MAETFKHFWYNEKISPHRSKKLKCWKPKIYRKTLEAEKNEKKN